MNFINVKSDDKVIMINLDTVTGIVPTETGTIFYCIMGSYETQATIEEVEKVIDTMQHRSNRVRIDGLKGETLNVKVVNK